MRPFHLVLVALALLAGSAGYVTHRWLQGDVAAPLAGTAGPAVATVASSAGAAAAAPLDWRLADPAGAGQRLGDLAGRVTVLNFWATWCPPCLREIPAFVALQREHADDGLQFIGIALDEAAPVADFVAEKGINYPVLVGSNDVVRLMQTLGNDIGGLPYTVVLDAAGTVLLTHQGEWAAAAAAAALGEFLKAP
ncbi:MAG: TlpA disulfide reductase family protein [Gammaproteobacteria bacterium]